VLFNFYFPLLLDHVHILRITSSAAIKLKDRFIMTCHFRVDE
jgi:hypothetical protein